MNRIIFLLLIILPMSSMGHKGHTAFFWVSNQGDRIMVKTKFEINDLLRVLPADKCELERLAFWASAYASDNFRLELDGRPIPLHMESSAQDDGYLILYLTSDHTLANEQAISISNTCFLGLEEHFHNNLVVEWNNEMTSYNLNKDRTLITHQLQ